MDYKFRQLFLYVVLLLSLLTTNVYCSCFDALGIGTQSQLSFQLLEYSLLRDGQPLLDMRF